MSQLLQRAFSKAAELPRAEQDRFARFLLVELVVWFWIGAHDDR